MTNFIDAWDTRTGQKLDYQIPDTWIPAGVAPFLSATDPADSASPDPEPPVDIPLTEPPTDVAAELIPAPVTDPGQNLGEV